MHIHFIGIGGIGISTVAQFCHNKKDTITGSEMQETVMTERLRALGISLMIPQRVKNIPQNCDLVVYSEAVPPTNPERQEAERRKIPQKSYFEFLGDVTKDMRTIAVAGTHGKTSTCGLLAAAMKESKFDASFFVGSTLREFDGSNFHQGSNEWAVVEACEYRDNFRFLNPEILILTNIEWDHPDYYDTEEKYFNTFRRFVQQATTVIYHADDTNAVKVLNDFTGRHIAVHLKSVETGDSLLNNKQGTAHVSSMSNKNILSSDICHLSPEMVETSIHRVSKYYDHIDLTVTGHHNRANASLALAVAHEIGIDETAFRAGLQTYTGAGRRLEYLGQKNGITLYDDYGHHPTEIRATLQAVRERHPEAQIGLIYEPHQFSRTRLFFDEFVSALSEADHLGLFPIYEARDSAEDKAATSIDTLQKEIPTAQKIETHTDVQNMMKNLEKGDVLLFMGAGQMSEFVHQWLENNSK